MFGLISKKKVAKVLLEAYVSESDCGGDFATHQCGGNYFDRHNTINWIALKLNIFDFYHDKVTQQNKGESQNG